MKKAGLKVRLVDINYCKYVSLQKPEVYNLNHQL